MFRAIKRSLTEGIRGMFKNGLMSITSIFVVTACIFVFGIFLMITLNINHITETMADNYQIDVYVEKPIASDGVSYDDIKEHVRNEIMLIDNIDTSNITLVDGKKKFDDFKSGLDAKELQSYSRYPDDFIPDSFEVRMKDIKKLDSTYEALIKIEGVESVENSNDFARAISGIKDIVKTFSVWIIVVFAIISLFIISNTIKLTVHNRRKEINIMKYVGATDSYIKGPFIMEGVLVGVVSAVVAFFVSQWSYLGLMSGFGEASFMTANDFMPFADMWANLLASYLLLGCFIGAFGSSISVRRYLKV